MVERDSDPLCHWLGSPRQRRCAQLGGTARLTVGKLLRGIHGKVFEGRRILPNQNLTQSSFSVQPQLGLGQGYARRPRIPYSRDARLSCQPEARATLCPKRPGCPCRRDPILLNPVHPSGFARRRQAPPHAVRRLSDDPRLRVFRNSIGGFQKLHRRSRRSHG